MSFSFPDTPRSRINRMRQRGTREKEIIAPTLDEGLIAHVGLQTSELKGTEVLEMPMEEATAKVRAGPPIDEPEDMDMPIWAGVIPLRQQAGANIPDPKMPSEREAPDYVVHYRRPGGGLP